MRTINFSVPTEHTAYIGSGASAMLCRLLGETAPGMVAVITDSGVPEAHLNIVMEQIRSAGVQPRVYSAEAGERGKTLTGMERIYGFLYESGLTRRDCIIALGGGVVGDMAGFAAATYLRGVRYINLATTLIAQTDSAYGGKTGVDFESGKNYVGCFYAPEAVICDTDFLTTLPEAQRLCGMGEVIKYGAIADGELLSSVAGNGSAFPDEDTIFRCASIKKSFVEDDPFDFGKRRALNFGHTFGHAIEAATGYTVPHGQAVAYGMLAAAHLGERLDVTGPEVYSRILAAVRAVGLDIDWQGYAADALPLIMRDKKAESGGVEFVLLQDIAKPVKKRLNADEIWRAM